MGVKTRLFLPVEDYLFDFQPNRSAERGTI
jgi:hypothetical protein